MTNKYFCLIQCVRYALYLDVGCLGNCIVSLLHMETVRRVSPARNLVHIEDKSAVVSDDLSVDATAKAVMSNIQPVPCDETMLFWAPVDESNSVETVLSCELTTFCLIASRLTTLKVHNAQNG